MLFENLLLSTKAPESQTPRSIKKLQFCTELTSNKMLLKTKHVLEWGDGLPDGNESCNFASDFGIN